MSHFEFEYPYIFLLLLLIVCIYRCPAALKKIIFPHISLFSLKTGWFNRDRLLYSLIFALMISALASPISYDSKSSHQRKGRDLVFALDASGSMGESGFDKEDNSQSKFDILKSIISKFVNERYDDNVGVTVFGSYAFSSVPLTYDMNAITYLIDFLDVGIAGENTAIGEGIANATRILQKGEAKEKVIILVTDGYHNSGSVSPKDALTAAVKKGIKIYTVGIGKKGEFDKDLLQLIAEKSHAKMFSAADSVSLQKIYDEIDRLEPSRIRSENYLYKHALYLYPLLLASVLLLGMLLRRQAS
ncbi:VWA domain-containing protein [Sulfurimonas sp. HSL-1716]|uniref:VWA domain-containing protein n=1 Tax=Hydrocurvibacter sulfurireducens TaxID=3131937 RepID=UPI0031FA3B33